MAGNTKQSHSYIYSTSLIETISHMTTYNINELTNFMLLLMDKKKLISQRHEPKYENPKSQVMQW